MKCATVSGVRGVEAMCGVDSIDDIIVASFVINVHAHILARFVLLFAPLVDASLSICFTLSCQLVISWACHQNIDGAFDFLGG
jgi:hypothetical protein